MPSPRGRLPADRRHPGAAGTLPATTPGRTPELSQPGHFLRQLRRTTRRLAEPEGNRWWLALGVDDAHLARLDFLDQIGPVAQLEDVARHTLDGEILVERSDEGLRRLEDHPVVADVRNRPARRERGEPGAAARA